MIHKKNPAKMLIFPLAILLLSSTVVMATSNSILPSAAYAVSFGSTKNLSDNDGDSLDPRIDATGNNVYTVWSDSSGDPSGVDANIFFKRSITGGDTFQATKDLSEGKDGNAQDQQIVKEGSNVYVVWSEDGDVFFKKSTNNGQSFGSTINLSNDDHFSHLPQIAVVGNNVYIVWDDVNNVGGTDESQLLFKRSTNGGTSFSDVKKITDIVETFRPRIAASGDNVYIAFTDGSEDNMELAFTRSTNEGSSFSKVIGINNNNENSVIGDIAAVGNNVYITWKDESNSGVSHAFFIRSSDGGKSFGSIKDFGPGDSPQLDTVSSNVYVVWANGDGNIAFRASTNSGSSFGGAKILSNDGDSSNPQISSSGNAVRIVWESGNPNSDVFFRASGNQGSSFGSTKNLSNNDGDSNDPQIVSSGGKIYVVWSDDTDNTPRNFDILFKKGVD